MRYPKPLPAGGTIGFIAPSFGCAIEPYESRFKNALRIFNEMGYQTYLGPNCYEGRGIGISNTPQACADELCSFMSDGDEYSKSDAVITCGGGELMCEVVPYIDFERISRSEPKWYMGYSDNTNYTFLSAILADTAAIYGPCAPAYGREPWHESIQDALDLLTGRTMEVSGYDKWELYEMEGTSSDKSVNHLAPYNMTETTQYRYYLPDTRNVISGNDYSDTISITGRMLGGCVDILTLLTGTKYDKVNEFIDKYREDGIVWFLECCDLDNLSMRRAYWQLREAGWFRSARAILIGRPRRYGEDIFGVNQYNAVTDILGDLNIPIIMDLDIGHLPPMMPIICGSMASITARGNKINIKYDFV